MIKDIKKIDLQGNDYYQESIICNRCKKVLAPEDYYHKIELTQWRPVKIEPGHAYGLSHHEPWHMRSYLNLEVASCVPWIPLMRLRRY